MDIHVEGKFYLRINKSGIDLFGVISYTAHGAQTPLPYFLFLIILGFAYFRLGKG